MLTDGISEAEYLKFHKDTEAFTWGFKQDVFTFLKSVNEKGYTLDFAIRCILIKKEHEMRRVRLIRSSEELWKKNGLKCPECDKGMSLEPVNTGPGDQVPGGWKSIWRCVDTINCGHEELSKKTVVQWIKKLHLALEETQRTPLPIGMVPEELLEPKGPDFNTTD